MRFSKEEKIKIKALNDIISKGFPIISGILGILVISHINGSYFSIFELVLLTIFYTYAFTFMYSLKCYIDSNFDESFYTQYISRFQMWTSMFLWLGFGIAILPLIYVLFLIIINIKHFFLGLPYIHIFVYPGAYSIAYYLGLMIVFFTLPVFTLFRWYAFGFIKVIIFLYHVGKPTKKISKNQKTPLNKGAIIRIRIRLETSY